MGHHRMNSFFLLWYHYLILFSGGSMQDLWMGGALVYWLGWIGTVGKLALPIPPPPQKKKFEASLRPWSHGQPSQCPRGGGACECLHPPSGNPVSAPEMDPPLSKILDPPLQPFRICLTWPPWVQACRCFHLPDVKCNYRLTKPVAVFTYLTWSVRPAKPRCPDEETMNIETLNWRSTGRVYTLCTPWHAHIST